MAINLNLKLGLEIQNAKSYLIWMKLGSGGVFFLNFEGESKIREFKIVNWNVKKFE